MNITNFIQTRPIHIHKSHQQARWGGPTTRRNRIPATTVNQCHELRNRLGGNRSPQNPLDVTVNQILTRRWVSRIPGIHRPIKTQACTVTTESTQMRPMKTLDERRFVTISAEIKGSTITWEVETSLRDAETNYSGGNILFVTTLGWVKYWY